MLDNSEKSQKKSKEEDQRIIQLAIQKKMVSFDKLQECIAEQNKLSHEGKDISLLNILCSKNFLSQDHIDQLKVKSCEGDRETQKAQEIIESMGISKGSILIDKYEVIEKLGSGGMGAVYKVKHTILNKFFALKIMHPCLIDNENSYKRFIREVEVAMKLVHKNIVTIRDLGIIQGKGPFFTMDFSEGVTLADLMEKSRFGEKPSRLLDISIQVLRGLEEAHSCGCVHRDSLKIYLLKRDMMERILLKFWILGLQSLLRRMFL